jgi:hypothetical protein
MRISETLQANQQRWNVNGGWWLARFEWSPRTGCLGDFKELRGWTVIPAFVIEKLDGKQAL